MMGSVLLIRIGEPPYLECSSRGDKRFSAFYAKVNGKPIEVLYQKAKIFPDGSTGLTWKEVKKRQKAGEMPVNIEELTELYKALWRDYLKNNPSYVRILKRASGLSDVFGQEGHNCQAITLWELREEM